MPKKDREHEMQTKYIQLQVMKQQLTSLVENKQAVDAKSAELMVTIDALHSLEDVEKGKEMWSSLGSNVFVMSDIKDTEKVLVAIGAGVVAREKKERAIEIMQGRLDDIEKLSKEIVDEASRIASQMQETEKELEKLAEEVSKTEK